MINYTIIIPHKNIPHLLLRCLDSIPERDDVQVIVVDDNSDPEKVDFNNFPGLTRKNTEVYFTKEGKGAGYARNIGLKHAKGKWLLFADADDFFMPVINEILDKYRDCENLNAIYFRTTSADSETLLPYPRIDCLDINKKLDKIVKYKDWNIAVSFNVPWSKFIKRDIVFQNNISFQETKYSNDAYFSAYVGAVSTNQLIDNTEIYCTTYSSHSLSNNNISTNTSLIRFTVALDTFLLVKRFGKEKYCYKKIFIFWCKIFVKKPILALSLLFRIIPKVGLTYFVKGIFVSFFHLIKTTYFFSMEKVKRCSSLSKNT